ncbi:hypothetical protein ACJMK2_012089 [Sinanodonta woodiana]|uniref:Anaphase promoting complex subunit 7 n=1 Tax=Sinanodonta woodiana TaxID=1069815 RepID=A0ABD3V7E7_SINWO
MLNLFDHINQLHECELYQDLKQLTSVALTLCDNSSGETEVLTLTQKYQTMVFCGNAHYQLAEYLKAEDIYLKALQLRKALNKNKGKTTCPQQGNMEMTSEVEVKYKVYQCLVRLKQHREAMTILEGISTKQRTAKINLALARLYLRAGMDRSAITSFKEVLRECPLALEAVHGLLSLGQKGTDVVALVMSGMPHGTICDWLSNWIRGYAFLASHEYNHTIYSFKLLDTKTYLKDNIYLLAGLAQTHFLEGQYSQALLAFQRAHARDPLHLSTMDMYAFLLYKDKKVQELQRLAQQLMSVSEHASEPWIAMGYLSLVTKKAVRAVYFAQKANNINPCNVEAFLLKGTALLEIKKTQEAIMHYQEALRVAPHRYEAYAGLIECYLMSHRNRDALSWSWKAIKTLGSSARTLTLYASVLGKDKGTVAKAKTYLERAMSFDPTYLEPVYLMAEILATERQFEKGIDLLRKQLISQSTCRLHQMLADFLTQTNEHQEALDHYNKALGLDPSNIRAKEGMERVEKQNDIGMDNSFDVEVEDMGSSDHEGFDFDDVESTWSDTEFS